MDSKRVLKLKTLKRILVSSLPAKQATQRRLSIKMYRTHTRTGKQRDKMKCLSREARSELRIKAGSFEKGVWGIFNFHK